MGIRQWGGANSTSPRNSTPSKPTLPRKPHQIFLRGVPATSIMTSPVGSSTSAEPRSGSFQISTNGSASSPCPPENTRGLPQFLRRPAQIIGGHQNEGQLGEFTGLKLEKRHVDPPARAPAVGLANERDQHRHQAQDHGPIGHERPPGQRVIIHQADRRRRAQPQRIPDDLAEPDLAVPDFGRLERGGAWWRCIQTPRR
jgi:hypothetical protein